jgi:hypothetical protein
MSSLRLRSIVGTFGTKLLLLSLVAVITSCAEIPLAESAGAARQKLASDLNISPDSIQRYDRCVVGRVREGQTVSPRVECVYLETADGSAVLDYDTKTKKFIRVFTFDSRSAGVAIQSKDLLFGKQAQLQLQLYEALLVVELVNADLVTLGKGADVAAAYEHLRRIGVPATTPVPFVERPAPPRVIYIPIYIPSSK